jgi:hypothetical protein
MKNAMVSVIAAALLAAGFANAQNTAASTTKLPTDTQSETTASITQTPSSTFVGGTITSSASLTRSTEVNLYILGEAGFSAADIDGYMASVISAVSKA